MKIVKIVFPAKFKKYIPWYKFRWYKTIQGFLQLIDAIVMIITFGNYQTWYSIDFSVALMRKYYKIGRENDKTRSS